MKWQGRRQSTNVDDRRGRSGGGGGGRMPGGMMGGGLGLGGILIVVLYFLFGGGGGLDFLGFGTPQESGNSGTYQETALEAERRQFLSVVLAETEDTWTTVFEQYGRTYRPTTLTLFTGQVNSGCGYASAQVGPFYCGADNRVYMDMSFFDQMENQLGAKGDFAMAYVLAHEVGHHVQNELGILDQVNRARQSASETEANDLSVRLELQADYLAGVWAHYAERANILEAGDLEEAITATQAIGDDTLQKEAQGYVVPDSFTHGTSAQRTRWYMKGFEAGDLSDYDTFSAASSTDLALPFAAPFTTIYELPQFDLAETFLKKAS